MDVSKQITIKKRALDALKPDNEIDLVLRHLRAAEARFESGKESADQEYFTDVIYRTNQVYEGILKELYDVVVKKKSKTPATHAMEKALDKVKALSPKVLSSFTIYRQDWRNPSTHDHRIDFDEQEAFMAIMNVSTFCYVAIDQIVYSIKEAEANKSVSSALSGKGFSATGLTKAVNAQRQNLILNYSADNRGGRMATERELEGVIAGIVSSLSPQSDLAREPILEVGRQSFRPDLLISEDKNKIAIEIVTYKSATFFRHLLRRVYERFSRPIDDEVIDQVIIIAIPLSMGEPEKANFKVESIEEETEKFLVLHTEDNAPKRRRPPTLDDKTKS